MSERPNYLDKINKILDNINPGSSEFKLIITGRYLKPKASEWNTNLPEEGFYEYYINRHAHRTFNIDKKKWILDKDTTINQIESSILNSIDGIFRKCSPNKAPRRTKIYKSFCQVVYNNKGTIEFINSVFDIAEYYKSVTGVKSIITETNDVHRKNIYQLLCLMEKNYGSKREKNSNG